MHLSRLNLFARDESIQKGFTHRHADVGRTDGPADGGLKRHHRWIKHRCRRQGIRGQRKWRRTERRSGARQERGRSEDRWPEISRRRPDRDGWWPEYDLRRIERRGRSDRHRRYGSKRLSRQRCQPGFERNGGDEPSLDLHRARCSVLSNRHWRESDQRTEAEAERRQHPIEEALLASTTAGSHCRTDVAHGFTCLDLRAESDSKNLQTATDGTAIPASGVTCRAAGVGSREESLLRRNAELPSVTRTNLGTALTIRHTMSLDDHSVQLPFMSHVPKVIASDVPHRGRLNRQSFGSLQSGESSFTVFTVGSRSWY